MSTLPKIGDIVMSPHEKYKENGVAKSDQLDLTEGLTVNQAAHPELFAIHPSSEVLEEGSSVPIANILDCLTWDGEFLWAAKGSTVTQYDGVGQPTGFSFSVSPLTNIKGIAFDGEFLWVAEWSNWRVSKYTVGGVSAGDTFSVNTGGDTRGLGFFGEYLYIVNYAEKKALKYTPQGIYSGYIYLGDEDSNPRNLVWGYGGMWLIGYENRKIFKYTEQGVYTGESYDIPEAVVSISLSQSGGLVIYDPTLQELSFLDIIEEGLDSLTSPNPSTPYRIVADLTEEV